MFANGWFRWGRVIEWPMPNSPFTHRISTMCASMQQLYTTTTGHCKFSVSRYLMSCQRYTAHISVSSLMRFDLTITTPSARASAEFNVMFSFCSEYLISYNIVWNGAIVFVMYWSLYMHFVLRVVWYSWRGCLLVMYYMIGCSCRFMTPAEISPCFVVTTARDLGRERQCNNNDTVCQSYTGWPLSVDDSSHINNQRAYGTGRAFRLHVSQWKGAKSPVAKSSFYIAVSIAELVFYPSW